MVALGCAPVALLVTLCLAMCGSISPRERQEEQQVCRPAVVTTAWSIPIGESYRITSPFGPRRSPISGRAELHTGIDLASASRRAPILAASSGTVTRVENLGARSYGRWIEIDHGSGTRTRYAHLDSVKVAVGDQVTTGQQIGVEGASGGVTGAHLHFEVRRGGTAVDPVEAFTEFQLAFDGSPGSQSSQGSAVTAVSAQEVAAFLPSPRGVDRSGSLNAEQIATATKIVEVGQRLGLPPRAWAIALMTALQESTLGADRSTWRPNGDGDVGVFQQRAYVGWYADGNSIEENTAILNDVAYAAETFYHGHDVTKKAAGSAGPVGYHIPGLVNIKGWETMPLWQAAQKVQVSAFPLYYAKHEATVASLLPRLNITNAVDHCTPTQEDVPADGTIGEKVVAHALTQLGVPYSWGGGTPNGPSTGHCCSPGGQDGSTIVGFDCSGLALWAWAQVGVTLPHQSSAQQKLITPIQAADIQAGDLLFFPGHVGIADGKGGMIEAPRPGVPVRVTPNVLNDSYYGPRFTGAGRPNLETAKKG
ncbi:MAG: peptidoglycan DD-metalloendopeptidase family protein [Propionibacteriaceae bacterium]|nr:peptidoglycan DD-metalloendopeptidase family protein [Propionibacteriaceae bacterium]